MEANVSVRMCVNVQPDGKVISARRTSMSAPQSFAIKLVPILLDHFTAPVDRDSNCRRIARVAKVQVRNFMKILRR